MGLTIEKKDETRELLQTYCDRYSSIEKAAASLQNISESTVRSVLRSNYKNMSDEMFRAIRNQVGGKKDNNDFVIVDTSAVRDITLCLQDIQQSSSVTWVIAKAGGSKTETAKKYIAEHKNVFYVLCDEDMKKSDFAISLARAIGLRVNTQKRAREIIMQVVTEISEMEDAIIIFDEGDKLSDNILYYFITIYNYLVGKAGVAFFSTSYMTRRMELGLRYNKKGYQELYSRIGRRFYIAEENDANDIHAICVANGLTDKKAISEVIKDAEASDFDMRRVEKKIKAIRKKRALTGANA